MKSIILVTLLSTLLFANNFALFDYEKNNIKLYKQTVPSVVNVSNIKKARSWEYGTVEVPRGAGSGFIWDDQGHIITNYHVVAGGDKYSISFYSDKTQYEATFVGGEPNKDIAVLKLVKMPKNLKPLKVGTSEGLQVGQGSIAIGNPFGLDHTMTSGIISATGRQIQSIGGAKIRNVIQTDAAINPGNSGGPLINSSGELIGMNTMIVSGSGSSAGLGFAVPVDTIKRIAEEIIKYGEVRRPGIGIAVAPPHVKERFEIEDGIIVLSVQDGGPAKRAGIEGIKRDNFGQIYLGDVILKIGNTKTNSYDDIYHALESYKIGDEVDVTFKRKKETKTVQLRLKKITYD